MNDIIFTMSEELLAVPAQMHQTSEEYLALLTETYMGPLCKQCGGGCCSNCAEYIGYLRRIRTKGQLDYLKRKYGWDKKAGFLTPTGCRLPRSKRSWVCLSYTCQRAYMHVPEQVVEFIQQSRFWLQNPHLRKQRIESYGRQYA